MRHLRYIESYSIPNPKSDPNPKTDHSNLVAILEPIWLLPRGFTVPQNRSGTDIGACLESPLGAVTASNFKPGHGPAGRLPLTLPQVPRLEVGLEDLGVEGPAGRPFDQVVGGMQRAQAVDGRAQPGHEGCEVAARDRLRDLGHRRLGGGEELRRGHGAQRIGREVAPGALPNAWCVKFQ